VTADLERRAAGGDHPQRRAARRERRDVEGSVEHLLEVVEHQQHGPVADHRGERLERRAPERLGDVERGGDRGHHLGRRGHGGERDERRAARVRVREPAVQLDREARLTGAAVAGDGEHARPGGEARLGGREQLVAAE
jgi:hypothetical protein